MTMESKKKPQQKLTGDELEKVQGGFSWGMSQGARDRNDDLKPGPKQMERVFDDE